MEIKKAAVEMALKAGEMLKEDLGNAGRVDFKGEINIVTEADRRAEALIIDEIRKRFPDHGVITEESEGVKSASTKKWIIDPLDGTTNYSHGFPVFCVSIAFAEADVVKAGVVYNPMLDELFIAGAGAGAELNGKRIKVSGTDALTRGLLATGFPYDLRVSKKNNFDHFRNFSMKAQAIRRAGSAALDLCYTACGRFDGFWEMKLAAWDTAAASLMVKEAGGRVTDFTGGVFSIYKPECLATNGLIHDSMLAVLAEGFNG